MRYAVLSDIHANLEALRAVLDDARSRADAVVCLGDIVGYGADPAACIEMLDERAVALVAGNHEYAVVGVTDPSWFSAHALAGVAWTRERLDDDHRTWLGARPLVLELHDATLVHASPRHPEEWTYLRTAGDGLAAFGAFATRLCFVGHTHRPMVWSLGPSGPEHAAAPDEITLADGRRYIVNVGSVGQPRDRDTRAAYAVWDVEERRVTIRRVTYDFAVARRKILDAGLPRFLGDRLGLGV